MKKCFFSLLLLGLLPACTGFLEQEPGNQTSIDEQLRDWPGFQAALNGAYYDLEALLTDNSFSVYADLQGGNLTFTPSRLSSRLGQVRVPEQVENVYSFQDQAIESDLGSFYTDAYTAIAQVNLLLARIDGLAEASPAQKDQLKAEALGIRSLVHFLLLQVYAQPYNFTAGANHPGIAYVDAPIEIGGPFPGRASVGEVYGALVADLTEAEALSGPELTLPGPATSYFTPLALRALHARVALYSEQWKLAIDLADAVITNGGISLMPGAAYVSQWAQPLAPVSEVILELTPPVSNTGAVSGSVAQLYGFSTPADYANFVASSDLRAAFPAGDLRLDSMFLVEELFTADDLGEFPRPYYFTRKFQGTPGFPVLRLSELYLIRAESAARLGDEAQARQDLDALRTRVGLEPLPATVDLLDEVWQERRRELCFEGQLFFDLRRFSRDLTRGEDCLAQVCDLSYPSPFFVLPIPQSALDLNENLRQNPGY